MSSETVLLVYDAPQGTNPAAVLRAAGLIHLQGSAWLARPWQLSSEKLVSAAERIANAPGGHWDTIAFDSREAEHLRTLARSALSRDIDGIRAALRESLTRAALLLTDPDPLVALKSKHASYHALWRAKRALVAAETAATVFALMSDVSTLLAAVRSTLAAELSAHQLRYAEPAA